MRPSLLEGLGQGGGVGEVGPEGQGLRRVGGGLLGEGMPVL